MSLTDEAKESTASSPPPNLSNERCHSCDSCRARKTKCDGLSPCSACIARYIKKSKLSKDVASTLTVTSEECECNYSLAKRRGPVPGHKSEKKSEDGVMHHVKKKRKKEKGAQQQQTNWGAQLMNNGVLGGSAIGNIPLPLDPGAAALQQQILSGLGAIGLGLCANFAGNMSQSNMNQGRDAMAAASDSARQQLGFIESLQRQQQELHQKQQQQQQQQQPVVSQYYIGTTPRNDNLSQPTDSKSELNVGCEKTTVLELLPILGVGNPRGRRFRASYALSFGSMFQLPHILTTEELCRQPHSTTMAKYDVACLQAAQFAELAIGAMVSDEISTMFQLINASVLCLQDSVKEPIHFRCRFELARTFFLHSILRCYNGDMEGCFKYRRAAMNTLAKLSDHPNAQNLLAAIAFQDTLAYMLYNGSEEKLPDIQYEYPRISAPNANGGSAAASELSSDAWINFPLGINSDTSPSIRMLEGIACEIRSFVDKSQNRTCTNAKEATEEDHAVSSNIGYFLLAKAIHVISNEDIESEESSQRAFYVLKAVVHQPLLLFQGGPTNFLLHKVALHTARLINKLHKDGCKENSKQLFDEAVDLYNAVRVIFNWHNSKLPSQLRRVLPRLILHDTEAECGDLIDSAHDATDSDQTNIIKKKQLDIERECEINDKSFLVFLSGTFLDVRV